jgi:DNA-binding NarL/FixJ family response regulator
MSITVFLADDHAIVRDGLRVLLDAQDDIQVVGDAANGRQAVLQIEKLQPQVVLMDIAMPELNGLEATRQILSTWPSIQVIILSMHSTTEHILQALQAGARGYLLKESAGVEVIEAVRTVHSGMRYLSQKISDKVIADYVRQSETAIEQGPLAALSSREREVFQLVVEGKTNQQIADILFLSPKTVETYRSRMMQKLAVDDLASLVKFAIRHGLTSLD